MFISPLANCLQKETGLGGKEKKCAVFFMLLLWF